MSAGKKGGHLVDLKDKHGRILKLFLKDGIHYPPFPHEDFDGHLDSLRTFEARSTDVWINAFPKSGTHWMTEAVNMMVQHKAELATSTKIDGMLELMPRHVIDNMPSPRLLNTHLPVEVFPPDVWNKGSKIIYLVRNPKDIAVSFYYHAAGDIVVGEYEGTFEEFYNMGYPEKCYNGWFHGVKGWYNKHKNNPNVLFLLYEDIRKDNLAALKKIANFLGIDRDEDFLKTVVRNTDIDYMRKNKTAHHMPNSTVYRKGKVGNWKTYWTDAMNEEFDRKFSQEMKDCDLTVSFGI